MFKYEIAIPSFNRAHRVVKNTLALLNKHSIPMYTISIFVNNSEQYVIYQEALNEHFPNQDIKLVITNCRGIGKNRTFIRRYYPDNTNVVFLDDDIEEVLEKDKGICSDLNALFRLGFGYCEEENATLWGIPLVDNHFYMKNNVSTNLKYIGAVYGVVLTPEVKDIEINIDQWEDYLVSVEHFILNGKVIRLNGYGIRSKWYNADGGICSEMGGKSNRMNMLEQSAKDLCEKYKGAMKLYYKKDNLPNIRLNYRYIHPSHFIE